MTEISSKYDVTDVSTLRLDLATAKAKDVMEIHEAFIHAMRANTAMPPMPFKKSDWHSITPENAVASLMRNRPGVNRPLDGGRVLYYAAQMADDDWQATGQPVIFDEHEAMLDAQHRMYASVISGKTFPSFVVVKVKAKENLFAYIDASKPRNAATALQTAGHNGVSPIMVRVMEFAEQVKAGVYNPTSRVKKLRKFTNAQSLALLAHYPGVKDASRASTSDWEDASKYIGGGGSKYEFVVAYVGMLITEMHGEARADEFFDELSYDNETRASDDPIAALRKSIDRNNQVKKGLKKHQIAANIILAFNAWHIGGSLSRKWVLADSDDFPSIVGRNSEDAAVAA
jgi:hypothetical protein